MDTITMNLLWVCPLLLFSQVLVAAENNDAEEPAVPTQIYKQANSPCTVKSSGVDYTEVVVLKNDKQVFKPDCDCKIGVSFSPSGHHIAFTNSEADFFKMDDERDFRLVIYNCDTGKAQGYLKGQNNSLHDKDGVFSANWLTLRRWDPQGKSVTLVESAKGVKDKILNFEFKGAGTLP